MHYPHWVSATPELYFLSVMVHMLSPSDDHSEDVSMVMKRAGFIVLHAIVFVPHLHDHVLHNVQLVLGQGITAAWYGTFDAEWQGLERVHAKNKKLKQKGVEGAEELGDEMET